MEAVLYTDVGITKVASKLPKWHILAAVVGEYKQALVAWWGQLVCTDHAVLSDKEYIKTIFEFEGVVKTCDPSCQ